MTSNPELQLSTIGQIATVVHDVERAVGFYRDTLGMKLLFEVPGMAFFDCAGVRLMLGLPSAPEHDHKGSILYFKVDDIEAAHRTLDARGVPFERPPHLVHKAEDHELWLAFFHDPDGNLLALMSER